jgi:alpha-beta hydrolase superfamily lysophospholipase
MKKQEFTFKDKDGVEIFVYKWQGDEGKNIKGVIQIAHGMAEHALRYERFAEKLTNQGYIVYANDHRGHGKTAGSVENVGYCGEDGFNWMVEDLYELNNIIKSENKGLPVILLGHSMGSFLSQSYIEKYGDTIDGVILSGTAGKQGFLTAMGEKIAKKEVKKVGAKTKSEKMNNLSFGSYNNSFKPTRTDFDWLSRDEKEVDKYIADPYCGAIFSAGFFVDLLGGLKDMHKVGNMAKIPKNLPILFIAGEKDPVGKNNKTIRWLIDQYKNLGINNVKYNFYKDARHEVLNETNRDEVVSDILDWTNSIIQSKQ